MALHEEFSSSFGYSYACLYLDHWMQDKRKKNYWLFKNKKSYELYAQRWEDFRIYEKPETNKFPLNETFSIGSVGISK